MALKQLHRQRDERHVCGSWHRPPPKVRYDPSEHCTRSRARESARARRSAQAANARDVALQLHRRISGERGESIERTLELGTWAQVALAPRSMQHLQQQPHALVLSPCTSISEHQHLSAHGT